MDWEPHLTPSPEWPYIAPRVEFVLSGFDNEKFVFIFLQVPMQLASKDGVRDVHGAECKKCGTRVYPPEVENLKEHGRLHLAVELAKRP